MTPAEARQRIEDGTQWRATPALSVEEIDRLLAHAQTVDLDGLLPGDPAYVETYTPASVQSSIATGWDWKLGKVAGQTDLRAGDVALNRSQAYANLAKQASRARSGSGSGGVGGIGVITITTMPDAALWPYIRTTDSL